MAKVIQKNGKFIFDYRESGIRKRPTFATEQEANQALIEFLQRSQRRDVKTAAIVSVGPPEIDNTIPKRTNLRDAIRKYYDNVSVAKSSRVQALEKYYFNVFYDFMFERGIDWVDQIRLIEVQEFQTHLRKDKSGSTVNRMFNAYRNFFWQCEMWEWIVKNPCQFLKQLPIGKTKREIWSSELTQRAIKTAPEWCADVIYFIALTGARPIEVREMEWDDVDIANKRCRFWSCKGKGSFEERWMPMTETIVEFMGYMLEKSKKAFRASGVVLIGWNNKPIEAQYLTNTIAGLMVTLNYKGRSLYGLRHAFGQTLADKNVNLQKIGQLMGHKNAKSTQTYTRLSVDQLRGEMETVSNVRQLTR